MGRPTTAQNVQKLRITKYWYVSQSLLGEGYRSQRYFGRRKRKRARTRLTIEIMEKMK